jgi:hypothetical protein
VIDRLRAIGLRIARSPGAQLVAGGLVLALAFPAQLSGTIGLTILAGALGVGVAMVWPRLPAWLRQPPERVTASLVVTIVIVLGLSAFWDTLTVSPDWQMGDWGPQHAVLANAMPSFPGADVPVWNHRVSTGDAPFELYPSLTYVVTGHVALGLGLDGDLPHAMMIVAVLVHVGIAVTTALLAMKVAPRPVALAVGALTLVESGAVAHGGTVGLFRWALLHSALALLFATVAALGVIAAMRRPRLAASIAIWIGTALACITHPVGLIAALAAIVALCAVALLAHDVPPRRALVAIGHVVLGVALGAAMWMPLADRILEYGQHFPNPIRTPSRLLEDLLQAPSPHTAFAMLVYAGYFGIIAGLWSRRATLVYLAATALVLLVGLCDAPYLAYLSPDQAVARLGTERLAQLARPFLAATGAAAIAIFVGHALAAWRVTRPRHKFIAAAVAGILACALARTIPNLWVSASGRASGEAQVFAADRSGRLELGAWAAQRASELRPDAWSRVLFETDTHEHFHLTARTGLPTFHAGPQPDLLLRERIEDLSDASLRRFNVRWAIASDKSPEHGDPATERVIGTFHIRDLADWDGQFARIERGTGTVRTLALDDRHVEIEVTATEPVLVALGTGYYPRWRARHASGAAQPVYAQPTIEGGRLHVVSAWVAPGRTTFTVDGPLPSDGDGRVITVLALLFAIAAVVAWRITRVRVRILRRLARLRRHVPVAARVALQAGVPVALVVLLAKGCVDQSGRMRALELGSGLRGSATVEARLPDGAWQTCDYRHLTGLYACDNLVVVHDAIGSLLNDAPPSWAFNTPAILASAYQPGVEMRLRVTGTLSGTYWMAASGGTTTLAVSGESEREVDRAIVVYSGGERTIEVRAEVPTTLWTFTFVHQDTIVPPRPYLDPPPATAPAEIHRITAR